MATTPDREPRFLTTRWSVVVAAGGGSTPDAKQAFETLAESYWYPLYAFLRGRGVPSEEACDVVQGFFVRLLEKGGFEGLSPERGRFRSFMIACLKNFLANERDRAEALKRGGGRQIIALDAGDADERYAREPFHNVTPEKLYERSWARELLDRAFGRLAEMYRTQDKARLFEELCPRLTGADEAVPLAQIAAVLDLSEGAVKVALHRLRRRFGALLRDEVAQTLTDQDDLEDEVRRLVECLGRE